MERQLRCLAVLGANRLKAILTRLGRYCVLIGDADRWRFTPPKVASPLLGSNRVERRRWRLALRASVARLSRAWIEIPDPLGKKEKGPEWGPIFLAVRRSLYGSERKDSVTKV